MRSQIRCFGLLVVLFALFLPTLDLSGQKSEKRPDQSFTTQTIDTTKTIWPSSTRTLCIPFVLTDTESTKEVRLSISTDGGKSWLHSKTASPDAKHFSLEVPRNGIYHFSVQTVSVNGELSPRMLGENSILLSIDVQQHEFTDRVKDQLPVQNEAFTLLLRFEAKEAMKDKLEVALKQLLKPAKNLCGSLAYELSNDPNDPAAMQIHHAWAGLASFGDFISTKDSKALLKEIESLTTKAPEVTVMQFIPK